MDRFDLWLTGGDPHKGLAEYSCEGCEETWEVWGLWEYGSTFTPDDEEDAKCPECGAYC